MMELMSLALLAQEADASQSERQEVRSEYVHVVRENEGARVEALEPDEVLIVTVIDGKTQARTMRAVQFDPEKSGLEH